MQKDDGSDSIAVQLADEAHWKDLVIIIAVVCVYLIYIPVFHMTYYIFFSLSCGFSDSNYEFCSNSFSCSLPVNFPLILLYLVS
jgi:hypothetical protein